MRLDQLLQVLPEARVCGPVDATIVKVESDSRRIGPGDLFVAIRGGQEQDRHRFVPDALARGARAVVVEEEVDCQQATRVVVKNCRQALAKLAAVYYNYPGHDLTLVGITGTKGKTTTALLMRQVLEAGGEGCGYLGTLGGIIGAELEALSNTTPEATELHRHLRSMVEAGKRAAVLEVSSHGLALERVAGLSFKVAIFTNLARDHLDFHQSQEDYLNAKARLFEDLDPEIGPTGIVNADDPVAPILRERSKAPVLTYGRTSQADVRLLSLESGTQGMRLRLHTPVGSLAVDTALTGGFNGYNAMAAVAGGLALGLDPKAICQGIAALERVPGRFERVLAGQDFQVIVDYAHTPESLEVVLRTARELTCRRLICLFGCGGDRDRGKRPLMGQIAEELADQVFLTSDNPRSEDPGTILAEIAAGMTRQHDTRVYVDRHQAIGAALEEAGSGDAVVIAGKGHETVQILADRVVPFDDREVARQALLKLISRAKRGT